MTVASEVEETYRGFSPEWAIKTDWMVCHELTAKAHGLPRSLSVNRVDADERVQIVAWLREHDGNRNKVAKLSGRSTGTIQTIATQENIPSAHSAPKNANAARRDFAKGERLLLLNKAFEKGEDLLAGTSQAKDFRELVIGIATLIDKRRVEDGEVSDRTENRKHDRSLEAEFAKLDRELDAELRSEGSPMEEESR